MANDRRIFLIRHGEKPTDPGDPGLSWRGQARAAALASYFAPREREGRLLRVGALFAAADKPGSVRTRATLEPLANRLGVPLRADILEPDLDGLRAAVIAQEISDVVVCWRHKTLLDAARALGASGLPDAWPEQVFDWVIELGLAAAGQPVTRLSSQRLMYGDDDHSPDPPAPSRS